MKRWLGICVGLFFRFIDFPIWSKGGVKKKESNVFVRVGGDGLLEGLVMVEVNEPAGRDSFMHKGERGALDILCWDCCGDERGMLR